MLAALVSFPIILASKFFLAVAKGAAVGLFVSLDVLSVISISSYTRCRRIRVQL
jgi:hypothetical protein